MALLSTQQITIGGATITLGAATASDTVVPSDRTFLLYRNTNAATRDITVVVPGAYYGQNLTDVVVTIAATTGEEFIGPIDAKLADPVTGLVTVTVTPAITNVTVAAIRV